MKIIVIGICLTSIICHAQTNLVLNSGFENTTTCPLGISQFNLATNWDDTNSGADSCATPDLYAGCSTSWGGNNSPNGILGYQPSRTGDHHAGIILYEEIFPGQGSGWREYIQGTLVSPLVAGQMYDVRFYVSPPDLVKFATDDIGVYFSNALLEKNYCLTYPHSPSLNVVPQLKYMGPPLVDSTSWTPLAWTYTATGGEKYFTIGNFENDSMTTVVPLNALSFNPYAYYYIDDVTIAAAIGRHIAGVRHFAPIPLPGQH